LYCDGLVEVRPESIRFRRYYFPFGAKTVQLSDVAGIDILPPGLMTGSMRIWGSGDLRTWFPCDWSRPARKHIYLMHRRSTGLRVGFTVRDDEAFQAAMRARGITLATQTAEQAQKALGPRFLAITGSILLALAILLVGLAAPMIAGRVGPNPTYGFRTPETLADPAVWYAANRFCGLAMLVPGGGVALAGALLIRRRRTWPAWSAMLAVALVPVLVMGALAASTIYLHGIR
jgi:uncharacterized membrane protein